MEKIYIEEDLRKYAQNMEIGDKFITKSRTISKTDVELFAIATGDYSPMFLDKEHANELGWNNQLTPGLLSYSIAVGLLYQSGFIADVKAYMGTDKMRFLAPVYPGDAIHVETEILSKKKTKRDDWICSYKWVIRNQQGDSIAEGENT